MKKISFHFKSKFTPCLLASLLLSASPLVRAQSTPTQDVRVAQERDITRGELASFDNFMTQHPEIAEQLRKNPSLVNDKEFVTNHSALRDYLNDNPRVREEIRENPNVFMHAEIRYDRREDERDRKGGGVSDITRDELQSFSTFLGNHRELAEQLRKNPSLVNDKQYVESHPELASYLRYHSSVQEEITENPSAFMSAENRFEHPNQDTNPNQDNDRNRDTNRRELASYDRFLDSHREIAEQLRKNPSLVDNQEFVKTHPALQDFLRDHPAVRQEIRENPTAFSEAESRFDRQEDRRDNDVTRRELANFDNFLDNHREISEQLRKNPSLVNNQDFVKNHPALETYLSAHPAVRDEIRENPDVFMQQEARYDRREDGLDRNRREGTPVDSTLHRHFGEFLGSHSDLAKQLYKDPSQIKNQEFLQNHPELKEYLSAHPDIRQQLMANPDSFIKSAQPFTNSSQTAMPPAAKPKPNQ
jgi:dsDNA-binding SOS-regulon protein